MIIFRNNIVCLLLFLAILLLFTGCKRGWKELSEKITKETTEESVEIVTKKAGKSSLKELGEKGIRTLNHEDFIALLRRDFPDIHTSFLNFDRDFQKDIVNAINRNPKTLDIILSSKTILDEFVVATSKIPSLSKNAGFFCHYISHPQFAAEIILRQSDNSVEFLSKSTNKIIGKYKDGVINVIEPFAKDGRTFSNQILGGDLIPNTLYKVRGEMGTLYQIQTDALGNVTTAQGRNISPENLTTNILRRNTDVNLGASWPTSYKRLKQYSNGADLDVQIKFNYTAENPNPRTIKIVATKGDKEILNELFENTNHLVPTKHSPASNSSLVKSLQKKLNIPTNKSVTLQNLMDADNAFADFIHSNPEFNIKRWLKTRNHVDEKLITRTPKGRFPPNARVYAGNVYYFNPYLNPGLASRLSNKNGMATLKKAGILSREQLEELDRLFPNGVPFSKSGFPDFTGVAAKGTDGKPIAIDIGKLSGDSKTDITKAESLFQAQGNKWEDGFTWHHIEGTTSLLRVPTTIHQLIDHAGGMSMSR